MGFFKMNEPSVASETIDGEVIIINLESGNYYSLQGVAAQVWEMIENGLHVSDIVQQLVQRYLSNGENIKTSVEGFVANLRQEDLIVPVEGPGNPSQISGDQEVEETPPGKPYFEPPVLNKYSDMQDLLFLDPIHEVDETGWPNVKQP